MLVRCRLTDCSTLHHDGTCSMYNGQGQGSEAIPCLHRATDEQPSDGTIHIFTQAPPSLPESQKQVLVLSITPHQLPTCEVQTGPFTSSTRRA